MGYTLLRNIQSTKADVMSVQVTKFQVSSYQCKKAVTMKASSPETKNTSCTDQQASAHQSKSCVIEQRVCWHVVRTQQTGQQDTWDVCQQHCTKHH